MTEVSDSHAVSMKITVFWNVVVCGLVEVYRRFRDACYLCYLHHELLADNTVQHVRRVIFINIVPSKVIINCMPDSSSERPKSHPTSMTLKTFLGSLMHLVT
jgi:hypothetical protein